MGKIYSVPTQDFLQKTLASALLQGVTASASLNNVTGISNLPGVIIIDRVDANGVETPAKVEVISFAGTSVSTVTTLVRGLAGTTDQDHAVSAVVEFGPDIVWAQSIYDALSQILVPSTGVLDTTKVVDLTTAQTLTNKVLTSPTINTPTITTPVLTGVPTGTSLDSIMPWTICLNTANQGGFDSTSGTWIWNVSSTSILGGWIAVNSPANTDFIQYQVALAAGTWQLTVGYKKFSSAGIAHVQIDGSDVGTVDMYAASPAENQWTQVSSISVATSGKHALKILMSTKNASSSNFQSQISSLQLNRTA